MDERLESFVRGHWAQLVRYAAILRAETDGAEQLVSRTVARAALSRRLRPAADPEVIDRELRRRLIAACIADAGRRDRDREPAVGPRIRVSYVGVSGEGRTRTSTSISTSDRVRDALAGLPPRQRVALVLRYFDDCDDTVAADLMRCSTATVSTQRADGLAAMAEVLAVDPAGSVVGDGSSRTEGLIRAAMTETEMPAVADHDPLAVVSHRVGWLRRVRLVVVLAGVVAVIVIAAIVTTTLRTGGDSVPPPSRLSALVPQAPVALNRSPSAYPGGVVAGGGYLWTVELHPTSSRAGTIVVRRNPVTGAPEKSYRVPEEDFDIAYGLGRVWVWGGGYTSTQPTVVTIIDPATSAVRSVRTPPGVVLRSVAFTRLAAWFTEPHQGRVLLIPSYDYGANPTFAVPGVRDAAAVSPTRIAVSDKAGGVRVLPSNTAAKTGSQPVTLVASTPSYGVWLGYRSVLTYQASIDANVSLVLRLPSPVTAVIGDPEHGLYAAVSAKGPDGPYLVYYSPAALRTGQASPTYRLTGDIQVGSLAPGPDGSVVFVTYDGAVDRWNPALPH